MSQINILSLNCLGGHIYRDLLKYPYGNPFIWTQLDNNDFIQLIETYETIDFLNYELIKESDGLDKFRVLIDDNIKLQFNHHRFDAAAYTPQIRGVDVFYNKIWEYIADIYEKRLSRMSKEVDLVAIDDWSDSLDIERMKEICTSKKYPLFICTDRLPEHDNDTIIIKPRIIHDGHGPGPGDIWHDYSTELKRLLKIKGDP